MSYIQLIVSGAGVFAIILWTLRFFRRHKLQPDAPVLALVLSVVAGLAYCLWVFPLDILPKEPPLLSRIGWKPEWEQFTLHMFAWTVGSTLAVALWRLSRLPPKDVR